MDEIYARTDRRVFSLARVQTFLSLRLLLSTCFAVEFHSFFFNICLRLLNKNKTRWRNINNIIIDHE